MPLEALGTTISRRSAPSNGDEEGVVTDSGDVLIQERAALDQYVHKKNEGALTLGIRGPQVSQRK